MNKSKRFLTALVSSLLIVSNVGAMASCEFLGNLGGNSGDGELNVELFDPTKNGYDNQTENDVVIPTGGYDGSAVTDKFSHTLGDALRTVLDEYIVEFNKIYPNITIEHAQVGSYDDVRNTIVTELSAGNEPNMAYCYPDHVALYNIAGAVVSMDNLITHDTLGLTDAQIADFIPGYFNEGKAFGDYEMYTLPFSKSTEVLYYNKTFFDQNNLKVPTTWDEMEALCAQIKTIDPNSTPLGYDSEANWFITMCEQLGSPYTTASASTARGHFLFDNDTNRNFVKEFRDWYEKGYVTTKEISGAYTSELFKAQTGLKSYMSIGSSAGANHQRPTFEGAFEVGIATIPQANPSKPKVISQGPSICIFKKDNVQEVIATWLFAKYLTTSVEFQAYFSYTSGYVPVIKSVNDNDFYKTFLESANGYESLTALSAKACLAQADAYYVSPAFKGSSTARDEVGALMKYCLSTDAQGKDVSTLIKEAFEDAIDECEYQAKI